MLPSGTAKDPLPGTDHAPPCADQTTEGPGPDLASLMLVAGTMQAVQGPTALPMQAATPVLISTQLRSKRLHPTSRPALLPSRSLQPQTQAPEQHPGQAWLGLLALSHAPCLRTGPGLEPPETPPRA